MELTGYFLCVCRSIRLNATASACVSVLESSAGSAQTHFTRRIRPDLDLSTNTHSRVVVSTHPASSSSESLRATVAAAGRGDCDCSKLTSTASSVHTHKKSADSRRKAKDQQHAGSLYLWRVSQSARRLLASAADCGSPEQTVTEQCAGFNENWSKHHSLRSWLLNQAFFMIWLLTEQQTSGSRELSRDPWATFWAM